MQTYIIHSTFAEADDLVNNSSSNNERSRIIICICAYIHISGGCDVVWCEWMSYVCMYVSIYQTWHLSVTSSIYVKDCRHKQTTPTPQIGNVGIVSVIQPLKVPMSGVNLNFGKPYCLIQCIGNLIMTDRTASAVVYLCHQRSSLSSSQTTFCSIDNM